MERGHNNRYWTIKWTDQTEGEKISMARWNFIKCWHIVEPSSKQLYVAMNLRTPHYQVGISERANFLNALRKKTSKTGKESLMLYPRTNNYTTNDFLTVINDESGTGHLQDLSDFLTFDSMWSIVEKYKEIDKEDSGQGNIFFDRGLSCTQNQMRSR